MELLWLRDIEVVSPRVENAQGETAVEGWKRPPENDRNCAEQEALINTMRINSSSNRTEHELGAAQIRIVVGNTQIVSNRRMGKGLQTVPTFFGIGRECEIRIDLNVARNIGPNERR